jgi:hypothetical protein
VINKTLMATSQLFPHNRADTPAAPKKRASCGALQELWFWEKHDDPKVDPN